MSGGTTEGASASNVARVSGAAAVIGGLAWLVKGLVILAGNDQPPLLFEIAPALFGIGLVGVAHSGMPASRRRAAVWGFGAVATTVGGVALASELFGDVAGAALAISSLALMVGLVTLERRRRWPTPLAWWIGVAMVPALIIGGMLSEVDERLLELPLIGLALAWIVVGAALFQVRPAVS